MWCGFLCPGDLCKIWEEKWGKATLPLLPLLCWSMEHSEHRGPCFWSLALCVLRERCEASALCRFWNQTDWVQVPALPLLAGRPWTSYSPSLRLNFLIKVVNVKSLGSAWHIQPILNEWQLFLLSRLLAVPTHHVEGNTLCKSPSAGWTILPSYLALEFHGFGSSHNLKGVGGLSYS